MVGEGVGVGVFVMDKVGEGVRVGVSGFHVGVGTYKVHELQFTFGLQSFAVIPPGF